MSAENLGRQLNNLVGQDDGALMTVDGFVTWELGTSVPGAVAGYEVGALFLKTDGGIGSTLYVNEGSRTSADFNATTTGALVNDTTPQLGGQLDVNGNAIGDGTLELLAFGETASAVNELTITNAATGNGPKLSATGDDAAVDLVLDAKGTGVVDVLASDLKVTAGDIILTAGFMNLGTAVEKTIATGAIAATQTHMNVDTESDAASDDLDTISGGTEGDIIILTANNTARTINITGAGNIAAGADPRALATSEDTITLIYNGTLSKWLELSYIANVV